MRVPEIMREMDETATAEVLHNMTFSAALSGQAGKESKTGQSANDGDVK